MNDRMRGSHIVVYLVLWAALLVLIWPLEDWRLLLAGVVVVALTALGMP